MSKPLILQTDFGLVDGAVSAMYGVAFSVDENLKIFDLTHDIQPYNVWEASYRLIQTRIIGKKGVFLFRLLILVLGLQEEALRLKQKVGNM